LGLISVPAALWSLKAIGGLSVAGLAAVSARLAPVRGLDPRGAAALVGLNPLVLVHVVGGAHNDGLTMLLLMGSIAALSGTAVGRGAGSLVTAVGVKASAGFAVPFALLGARPRSGALLGLLAGALAVGAVSLAVFGSHAADALRLVGENQAKASHYSLPATISRVAGADLEVVRVTALVIFGLTAIGLLRWALTGGDWLRATGWAALALLLCTSWLLPWYVIWALPLAAVARDRALTFAVLALCGFQLVNRVPL
jgi:hypothetical protein